MIVSVIECLAPTQSPQADEGEQHEEQGATVRGGRAAAGGAAHATAAASGLDHDRLLIIVSASVRVRTTVGIVGVVDHAEPLFAVRALGAGDGEATVGFFDRVFGGWYKREPARSRLFVCRAAIGTCGGGVVLSEGCAWRGDRESGVPK